MQILIVGTGYVGLVTATCLSEMGHQVVCLDIDEKKIADLQKGMLPIYEPGLKELVDRNTAANRLSFTTDYAQGVHDSLVCFIAVPTPSLEDGSCDLSYIYAAVSEIAKQMNGYKIIVNKSTVPVGTATLVKKRISAVLKIREADYNFDVVSNPEFLKEGCSIADCMKPDRIILGVDSHKAAKIMREIYSAFTIKGDRIFVMDTVSAEMTKYAANAMLALRISFMNELSHLCDKTGANIKQVRLGIGSDQRIGDQFLYAGAGYGGSCFPKDIRALSSIAKQHGIEMQLIDSIEKVNERQKKALPNKILRYFSSYGGIEGKTIAIWGLSFKPDTDDIREAPSLNLITQLLQAGAFIRAYDPVAMPNALKIFGNRVQFCRDEYDAALGADGVVLMTEWKQFRSVEFQKIVSHLNHKVLFDGRNQYELSEIEKVGMEYFGVGVPSSLYPLNPSASTSEQRDLVTL